MFHRILLHKDGYIFLNRKIPSHALGEGAFEWVGDRNKTPHITSRCHFFKHQNTCEDDPSSATSWSGNDHILLCLLCYVCYVSIVRACRTAVWVEWCQIGTRVVGRRAVASPIRGRVPLNFLSLSLHPPRSEYSCSTSRVGGHTRRPRRICWGRTRATLTCCAHLT